jgi:hypothetical protein
MYLEILKVYVPFGSNMKICLSKTADNEKTERHLIKKGLLAAEKAADEARKLAAEAKKAAEEATAAAVATAVAAALANAGVN